MSTLCVQSIPTTADDATFRAWGKVISDALQTIGITKTADTGQIDWTAATRTASVDTMVGYEIRQFTDTLQGTTPVFLKVEYGSGQTILRGCIRITVGQGSNGTGTLTGTTSTTAYLGQTAGSALTWDSYLSVNSGTFTFALWVKQGLNNGSAFYISRIKDSSGVDTSTGVNIGWISSYNTGVPQSGWQYLPASGTVYPTTPMASPMCAFPRVDVDISTLGLNSGMYPIYPNLGYPGNPDYTLVYNPAGFGDGVYVISLPLYGATHNFILVGGCYTTAAWKSINGAPVSPFWSLALRYE